MLSVLTITLLHERIGTGKCFFYIGVFIGLYLGFLSNSKAIIFGNVIFVASYIVTYMLKKDPRNVLLMLLIAGASFVAANFMYEVQWGVGAAPEAANEIYSEKRVVLARILNTGQDSDDNLAGRGYSRIVDCYDYLFFGAGEGLDFRFNNPIELHSTFGTLLFCYGLIGLYIIVRLMRLIICKLGFEALIYFLPLTIYSLSHNGLRSPLLWLFLMLVCADDILVVKKNKRLYEDN